MSEQLTELADFNVNNLVFDEPQKRNIPDSEISYFSANIRIKYSDGTKGPLIIQLPRCPTFGFSNKFGDSLDKLTMSIVLGDRDNWSDEHKKALAVIDEVIAACKKFSLTEAVRLKIGQEDMEERDLKTLPPYKYSKDKQTSRIDMTRPPTLYAKLRLRNNKETKQKMLESRFYIDGQFDAQGNGVACDPRDYVNKLGSCVPLIRIESIYYGAKPKIQVKIFECDIRSNDTGFKSLIKRTYNGSIKYGDAPSAIGGTINGLTADDVNDDDDDDDEVVEETVVRPAIAVDEESEEEDEDKMEDEPVKVPTPVAVPAPAPAPAASKSTPARRAPPKK